MEAGGARLNYLRKGSGQPLVLIHGTYSSVLVYELSVFDKLARKYDVTAIDLPGYGGSSRPKQDMSMDERAAVIDEAIHKLGIKKPVLVGHSSGAAFCLRYAMNYPDKVSGLALITPYIEPYKKAALRYRIAAKPVLGDLFVYGFVKPLKFFRKDSSMAAPAFYPDPVNEEYGSREVKMALRRKTFRYNASDLEVLGRSLGEMDSRYGEIKAPVTIVAGEVDPIADPKINALPLHKKIPHSKLITLPKTGHQPLFTKTDEVINAIDALVDISNKNSQTQRNYSELAQSLPPPD